jgi:hypothetical protein
MDELSEIELGSLPDSLFLGAPVLRGIWNTHLVCHDLATEPARIKHRRVSSASRTEINPLLVVPGHQVLVGSIL